MLYVKPDHPVDPIVVSIVHAVDAVAKALGLSYCLVGAMARDVLLRHVFGLDPGRATRDVDIAFALESWEQFQQIQDRLIAGGRFVAARDVMHRLLFSPDGATQRYIVDLIPFGGVEQSPHTIVWPPDMQVMMHVAGYAEALQTAPLVQVATGLIIHVVSLPGLALLKLLAWQERGLADPKERMRIEKTNGIFARAPRERALWRPPAPPAGGHAAPTALSTRPGARRSAAPRSAPGVGHTPQDGVA